jgi:hypothetical protein
MKDETSRRASRLFGGIRKYAAGSLPIQRGGKGAEWFLIPDRFASRVWKNEKCPVRFKSLVFSVPGIKRA